MGHKFSKILPSPGGEGPNLFIGTVDYIVQDAILRDLGIQAVVTLLPALPPETHPILRAHGLDPDSDHLLFPLEDCSEAYMSLFHDDGIMPVLDWIHAKRIEGKSVLVHCDAGLTRSPAVVSGYLMKYGVDLNSPQPLGYLEALAYVSKHRGPKVDVRLFERELRRLEQQLQFEQGLYCVTDTALSPDCASPSGTAGVVIQSYNMGALSPLTVALQLPSRARQRRSRLPTSVAVDSSAPLSTTIPSPPINHFRSPPLSPDPSLGGVQPAFSPTPARVNAWGEAHRASRPPPLMLPASPILPNFSLPCTLSDREVSPPCEDTIPVPEGIMSCGPEC
mmetsp:Transcript_109212/g.189264  ORF Transcript_109212/g.189264 Transcript_109212/m.189264 type:complete len:335 (-) Transcript_109212:548-1552(-)